VFLFIGQLVKYCEPSFLTRFKRFVKIQRF